LSFQVKIKYISIIKRSLSILDFYGAALITLMAHSRFFSSYMIFRHLSRDIFMGFDMDAKPSNYNDKEWLTSDGTREQIMTGI